MFFYFQIKNEKLTITLVYYNFTNSNYYYNYYLFDSLIIFYTNVGKTVILNILMENKKLIKYIKNLIWVFNKWNFSYK